MTTTPSPVSPLTEGDGLITRRIITPVALLSCAFALWWAHNAPAARQVSVRQAICDVFGSRCAYALRIARCESNFNPRAVGRAGELGAFQIHPVHFRRFNPARLFEPAYNAKAAYALSRGGRDWSAWTCRRYV